MKNWILSDLPLMADCFRDRNKDYLPHYHVRRAEMQTDVPGTNKETKKQRNAFLLHSTSSKIAVLIVYFRNYVKRT